MKEERENCRNCQNIEPLSKNMQFHKTQIQSKWMIYGISVLWALFLTACRLGPVVVKPTPATPPAEVVPLFLELAEFQWEGGYYGVEQTDFNLTPGVPMEHGWDVVMSPILHPQTARHFAYPDTRSLGQSVFVYKDQATAQRAFKEAEERISILPWGTYQGDFDPRLESVIIGCDDYRTPDSNISQQCNLLMQQGRYMVQAYILLDEQVTKMSDWDRCVALIQEKLIAQVEQEAQP